MPLQEVDWNTFQFRSHYFGELMTPTRGKTNLEKFNDAQEKYIELDKKIDGMKEGTTRDNSIEKLFKLNEILEVLRPIKDSIVISDTAKKRLVQIYTEQTTGRVKDVMSAYIEKGLKTEEDSITLYSLRSGLYYKKNKIRAENGFISGEIDFEDVDLDMTIDTKSSWDVFTFDATVAKKINNIYWWQGQCYMWLRNRKKHRLAYCLNNTPEEIIQRLEKRMRYEFVGEQEDYEEAKKLLREDHIFDDLPLERKIRVYDFDRDDEAIELAKSSIPIFRNYLKDITNQKIQEDANDI